MNKSEIFRQAHALARQVIQAGDDYRVTFGAALKSLQNKPAEIVDQLIALGGNLWEKGSMRRVYFNNVPALIGLSYSTYKTGNISSASRTVLASATASAPASCAASAKSTGIWTPAKCTAATPSRACSTRWPPSSALNWVNGEHEHGYRLTQKYKGPHSAGLHPCCGRELLCRAAIASPKYASSLLRQGTSRI